MIDAIMKVIVEVLRILAITTKEIRENRTKKYLKKLVGGTDSDIECALSRLENAILEETRMAAAEALKGIHVLQDRMRGVEGMLEGVGDMLRGFDGRMKDISRKSIDSTQITVQLVIFKLMSSLSDADNAACQRVNDVDMAPATATETADVSSAKR
ncbi:hypothetical protein BGY98DRAFT_310858 [Russula aff. rugulosa BPL654]|nr:hypothetical protein BGY98DRAFT_310858 [Russula aff. rugulosa BPL654]